MSPISVPRLGGRLGSIARLAGRVVDSLSSGDRGAASADELLAAQLAQARSALADGRSQDVVDRLHDTVARLQVLEASALSLLARAHDQLGQPAERDAAYRRSEDLYDATDLDLVGLEAVDMAITLAAVDRTKDARTVLRTALDRGTDPEVLDLLAASLDDLGDRRSAARAYALAGAASADPSAAFHRLRLAVDLDPTPAHRTSLARLLVDDGQVGPAAVQLDLAAEGGAKGAAFLAVRADVARRSGDPRLALSLADQAADADPDEYTAHLARATALQALHRSDEALTATRRALELRPGDARILGQQAHLLVRLGRLDEAEKALRRSDADVAEVAELATVSAEIHLERDDTDSALDVLDRAIGVHPDDADLHAQRARALIAAGREREALPEAERSLELDEHHGMALVIRAEIRRRRGDTDGALADLQRVPVDDERHAAALGVRGRILAEQGDDDEALRLFDRALALDSLPWVTADKASLLLADDPAAALALLDEAVQRHPGRMDLWRLTAMALVRLGRHERALEAATAARELAPEDVELLRLEGLLQQRTGDPDAALSTVDRALELVDDARTDLVGELRSARARILFEQGRPADAADAFSAVLAVAPGRADAYIGRGHCRYQLGDTDDAIDDYRAAAEHATDAEERAEALEWLGESLRRIERPDEALDALDAALEVRPDSAFAHGTRGQVLMVLPDRLDDAVDELRRATALDTSSAWAFTSLGEALRRSEAFNEALDALDTALRLAPDDPYAMGTRGQVLARLGRLPEAVVDLCRAAALRPYPWVVNELDITMSALAGDRPALESALTALAELEERRPDLDVLARIEAEALWALDRPQEALDVLEPYLARVDDDQAAVAVHAQVLIDVGRPKDAVAVADSALAHAPQDMRALSAKVRALVDVRRHRAALEAIEEAESNGVSHPWFTVQKANILAMYGRFDEALSQIEAVVADDPEDDFALAVAGYCLRRTGDLETAADRLDRAVALAPENVSYVNEQGETYLDLGRAEDAEASFTKVVDALRGRRLSDVGSVSAHAWALFRLGRFSEAVAQANEWLLLDPDALPARLFLGLALLRAGRPELALDEYEGAARLAGRAEDPELARAYLEEGRDDLRKVIDELPASHRDEAEDADAALVEALAATSEPTSA